MPIFTTLIFLFYLNNKSRILCYIYIKFCYCLYNDCFGFENREMLLDAFCFKLYKSFNTVQLTFLDYVYMRLSVWYKMYPKGMMCVLKRWIEYYKNRNNINTCQYFLSKIKSWNNRLQERERKERVCVCVYLSERKVISKKKSSGLGLNFCLKFLIWLSGWLAARI